MVGLRPRPNRDVMVTVLLRSIRVLAILPFLSCSVAWAECPPEARIQEVLNEAGLENGTRARRYGAEPPGGIYGKAVHRPGKPFASREGQAGFGVLVTDLPVESLWMAVNDDEHHALELPVRENVVFDGPARGVSRRVFGYFKEWGVGRWWLSRVEMNAELYRGSEGKLWELHWQDDMEHADPSVPPIRDVAAKIAPIVESHGAWLLTPVSERCTVVEYFTSSDPGGTLGATQWIMATRTIRTTLQGIDRLARDHVDAPHPGPPFVRPDGSVLGDSPGRAVSD